MSEPAEAIPGATEADDASRPPRQYGVLASAAIVVGVMVGSGIFFEPANVAKSLPGPGPAVLAWVLGGVMALAGALSFAELATAYPRSGGIYVYLRRAWGEGTGFVFAWTEALVVFPAANALLAIYFATAVEKLLPGERPLLIPFVAVAALVALGAGNAVSSRAGPVFAVASTAAKLAGIVLLLVAATVGFTSDAAGAGADAGAGAGAAGHLAPLAPPGSFTFLGLASALVFLYWAYSGWDLLTYLAGEARDPGRTVPLAMGGGVALVILVYAAVVIACHRAAPPDVLAGRFPAALVVAEQAFGARGGAAMNLLIVLTTFGALHGSLLAGSRLAWSAASDGTMPRALARVSERGRTPARAVLFQTALALPIAIRADLGEALGAFSIAGLALYTVAAAGVVRLRFTDPERERPYRVFLYPVTPLAFMALAVWVLVVESWKNPVAVAVSAGACLVGLIAYLAFGRRADAGTEG